ncbi:MAG: Trm112 family protein [Phycisphaerae bacterium]|nr:Trm112 family protein [Phycisphaerae bacterium]
MTVDPMLLEILVCPKCRSKVELKDVDSDGGREPRLVCTSSACGLRYPIREGIPIMLIDEAESPAPSPTA